MRQPLAGEMAARRRAAGADAVRDGYAIETALLLDVHAAVGLRGLAQVDLDVRLNDHKPLPALAPMADEVLAAVTARLQRDGRLTGGAGAGGLPVERPPMREVMTAVA